MIRTLTSAALALALVSGFSNSASAAAVKLRVLGWYGNQKQSTDIERPFWKELEKNTKEQVAADFRTIDEIGLKGFESMRTLRSGAFDIVSFQISFVGGEAPVLMGVDLPGLAFDFDGLRRTVDAYRPVLDANLGEKFNGKLLAAWPYPFQIVFCKGEMKTLADLKGQKIRVSGNLTAELVKQLGGAAVTLAGPEVYQALMQGVVDCAVTGSQFGNANDWFEVAKTQNTAPLGGAGVVLHVIRKESWNKLNAAQQEALTRQMAELERKLWAMAVDGHADGIRCNTGSQPCAGKPGKMKLVDMTEKDRVEITRILKEKIIPLWLSDCEKASATCKSDWAKTIGNAVGIAF